MTTLRQIESNRKNSEKSTGPRTEAGKEISKRNALKHGMAGAGVVLPEEEQEAVEERLAQWHSSLKPFDNVDEWLARQVVVASVQIDRCHVHETTLRAHFARRAETHWEEDRQLEAELLGARLPKKPAQISRQLRRSKQGADWLIARWEGLGRLLDDGHEWDEAQCSLALDMLGTPAELRNGSTRLDPEPGGDVLAWRSDLVVSEVGRLDEAKAEALGELDERERAAAELGLEVESPRPLSLLRRYEAACRRRMQWAMDQLRRARPASVPAPAAPAPLPPISAASAEMIRRAKEEPDFVEQMERVKREIYGRSEPKPEPAPAPLPMPPLCAMPLLPPISGSMAGLTTPSPHAGNRHDRRARRAEARRG